MARERHVRHGAGTVAHAGRWAAVVCAALLGLADGPALAAPSQLALVEATAPCCEDPSRFGYQTLPADGSVDFAIDRKSPLFEFQSGKSFFRAFRLPASGRPYTLELRSFLENPDSPRTARVFFPVLAILTDDFLVSRATDLDALRFDLPVLEQTSAPAYRVQLPLDPANTRERYLVVFTPAQLLAARGVQVTTPETASQAAQAAFLGASAFGRLRITLRPTTAAAGDAPDAGTPAAPPAESPQPAGPSAGVVPRVR